jgi:hypothetical protein
MAIAHQWPPSARTPAATGSSRQPRILRGFRGSAGRRPGRPDRSGRPGRLTPEHQWQRVPTRMGRWPQAEPSRRWCSDVRSPTPGPFAVRGSRT